MSRRQHSLVGIILKSKCIRQTWFQLKDKYPNGLPNFINKYEYDSISYSILTGRYRRINDGLIKNQMPEGIYGVRNKICKNCKYRQTCIDDIIQAFI